MNYKKEGKIDHEKFPCENKWIVQKSAVKNYIEKCENACIKILHVVSNVDSSEIWLSPVLSVKTQNIFSDTITLNHFYVNVPVTAQIVLINNNKCLSLCIELFRNFQCLCFKILLMFKIIQHM